MIVHKLKIAESSTTLKQGAKLAHLCWNQLNALNICARKPNEYAFTAMVLRARNQCINVKTRMGVSMPVRMRTWKL